MTAPTETGMMKVFRAQQGIVEQLVADNSALSDALQKFVNGMRAVVGKDQYDQKWLAEAEEALNKHGNGPEYQGWRNKQNRSLNERARAGA